MIKRIFLDVETTGKNPMTCGLWQIGGIIEAGKRSEEFIFECDIFKEDDVEEEALTVNGLTIDKLDKMRDPIEVNGEFQELMSRYIDKYDKRDKFYFINFGVNFDSEVLRQWFLKCGDEFFGSWFWHPPIDVMTLAMQDLVGKRHNLQNFKQVTVADYYGVRSERGRAHNALYDCYVAREIYNKITGENPLQPIWQPGDDVPF